MKLPLIIVRQQDLPLTNERLNKCAKIILDQLIDPQLNNYRIYEGQIMIKNTKRIGVGTTKKGEYAVLDDYIRLVFHCIPSDEKIYFTKEIYCGLVYDIKSNLHEHGYEYAKNKTYYAKNPIRLIRCVDCQKNVYVHNRIIRCLDCKDKYEKQNKKVRDKQRIGLDGCHTPNTNEIDGQHKKLLDLIKKYKKNEYEAIPDDDLNFDVGDDGDNVKKDALFNETKQESEQENVLPAEDTDDNVNKKKKKQTKLESALENDKEYEKGNDKKEENTASDDNSKIQNETEDSIDYGKSHGYDDYKSDVGDDDGKKYTQKKSVNLSSLEDYEIFEIEHDVKKGNTIIGKTIIQTFYPNPETNLKGRKKYHGIGLKKEWINPNFGIHKKTCPYCKPVEKKIIAVNCKPNERIYVPEGYTLIYQLRLDRYGKRTFIQTDNELTYSYARFGLMQVNCPMCEHSSISDYKINPDVYQIINWNRQKDESIQDENHKKFWFNFMNECYLTKEEYPKFYCYNIHNKLDIETEHKYKIDPNALRKYKIKVCKKENDYFSEYERKKHQKEICLTMFNYYNPTNMIYGDKKNKKPWMEEKHNRFKTLIEMLSSDDFYQWMMQLKSRLITEIKIWDNPKRISGEYRKEIEDLMERVDECLEKYKGIYMRQNLVNLWIKPHYQKGKTKKEEKEESWLYVVIGYKNLYFLCVDGIDCNFKFTTIHFTEYKNIDCEKKFITIDFRNLFYRTFFSTSFFISSKVISSMPC